MSRGLAERLGDAILRFRPAARSERCFMVIILALIAFLSAFMSNTAAVAMFMPLVSSVARASKGRIKKKNLFMAMGIASILGGNCTLAGSTPQLTAQGILENTPGVRTLTFFELAYIGVPLVLLMLFLLRHGGRHAAGEGLSLSGTRGRGAGPGEKGKS